MTGELMIMIGEPSVSQTMIGAAAASRTIVSRVLQELRTGDLSHAVA